MRPDDFSHTEDLARLAKYRTVVKFSGMGEPLEAAVFSARITLLKRMETARDVPGTASELTVVPKSAPPESIE